MDMRGYCQDCKNADWLPEFEQTFKDFLNEAIYTMGATTRNVMMNPRNGPLLDRAWIMKYYNDSQEEKYRKG